MNAAEHDELYAMLAATAEGNWGASAALWLLHQHGRWLPTLNQHGYIKATPDVTDSPHVPDLYAAVDWPRIEQTLNREHKGASTMTDRQAALLVGSGSERVVLKVACSLASTFPVRMAGLTGMDDTNRRLVLHAIAWAMGGRTYADKTIPVEGR